MSGSALRWRAGGIGVLALLASIVVAVVFLDHRPGCWPDHPCFDTSKERRYAGEFFSDAGRPLAGVTLRVSLPGVDYPEPVVRLRADGSGAFCFRWPLGTAVPDVSPATLVSTAPVHRAYASRALRKARGVQAGAFAVNDAADGWNASTPSGSPMQQIAGHVPSTSCPRLGVRIPAAVRQADGSRWGVVPILIVPGLVILIALAAIVTARLRLRTLAVLLTGVVVAGAIVAYVLDRPPA